MSFWAPRVDVRARKAHYCWVCGRTIQPGETYERQGSYQDGWLTLRTCAHCRVAVEVGCPLLGYYEWEPQGIFDVLAETDVSTARLAVGMRRRWRAFSGDGLMPIPAVEGPEDQG